MKMTVLGRRGFLSRFSCLRSWPGTKYQYARKQQYCDAPECTCCLSTVIVNATGHRAFASNRCVSFSFARHSKNLNISVLPAVVAGLRGSQGPTEPDRNPCLLTIIAQFQDGSAALLDRVLGVHINDRRSKSTKSLIKPPRERRTNTR